jgi:hypothetical protein
MAPSRARGEGTVPLSEDEERILSEIAQQFYADDPEFAREVGETTLFTHTVRRMKWSGFGFVTGVVFLIATLSTSYLLAFGGFLFMLGCALYFERNLRKLGKAGLEQITSSMKAAGLRDALGGARGKMRDRFRRADDDQ